MKSVWMRRVALIIAMALIVFMVLDHYFDLFDCTPDPLKYRGGRGFLFKDGIWVECAWNDGKVYFVILVTRGRNPVKGFVSGGSVPLHEGWSRVMQFEFGDCILEMKYDHTAKQLTINNKTMDTKNGTLFLCDISAGFAAVRQVSWDFGLLCEGTEEQQEQDLLRKLDRLIEEDPVTKGFAKDGGLWTHAEQEAIEIPENKDE